MIISLFIQSLKAIHRWYDRRRAESRLNALNDHLLRDIGIVRHEIPEVVAQGMANSSRAHQNWPIRADAEPRPAPGPRQHCRHRPRAPT